MVSEVKVKVKLWKKKWIKGYTYLTYAEKPCLNDAKQNPRLYFFQVCTFAQLHLQYAKLGMSVTSSSSSSSQFMRCMAFPIVTDGARCFLPQAACLAFKQCKQLAMLDVILYTGVANTSDNFRTTNVGA